MSVVGYRKRKKGWRSPRKRMAKVLRRRRVKAKIYKNRGWKLAYPGYFDEIDEYPYIVKKI